MQDKTQPSQDKRHCIRALCAGFLTIAATASADTRINLPVPQPSGAVDTESAVSVPLAAPMSVHRQFALMLTAEACPTGAVQVAFGVDQDGDADLAPEETALVVGNDCGVWFVRNECEGCGYEVQASTGAVTRVFTAKLDETSGDDGFFYASAWNLAKVTTRGGGEREAGIVAGLQAGGTMMIVK